jgi:hypothetical protein
MPCEICGHFIILYENDPMCPKCKRLTLLEQEKAIKVATRLVKLFTEIFTDELRGWERDTLLGNLVNGRELVARAYYEKFSAFQAGRLSAYTMLIKRVAKFSDYRGTVPKTKEEVDKLVDKFESVREFESILLNIKSGYKNILYLRNFDEDKFTIDEATATFRVVANESYLDLERTFAKHDIFSAENAEKKIKEYEKDYTPPEQPIEVVFIPPDEFIAKHYDILNQIFVLFHRDRASAECFNLEYLDDILNEPRDLVEFISSNFQLHEGKIITVCPTQDFIRRASEFFKVTKSEAKKKFVFDVNNKSIFPLFVRYRVEGLGDVICISKDFSSFIYTILHAIILKEMFDNETIRKSKEFENEKVKIKFEQIGYMYIKTITDKKKATIEIDGLAIKNQTCFVIECKGWRFPRLIDEPETREHIIRDLKGIVTGEKEHSHKNGKIKTKTMPSILKKVDYVKNSINDLAKKYQFDSSNVKEIKPLVVTIDYPPISEYAGVKMISIDDISSEAK